MVREREDVIAKYKTDNADLVYKVENNTATEEDLDKFKSVNNTYGHRVGDALLVSVASRMKHLLRESDTVGRVGGDEFIILLHPMLTARDAAVVAEKICLALAQPFELVGQQITISASMGIVFVFPKNDAYPFPTGKLFEPSKLNPTILLLVQKRI